MCAEGDLRFGGIGSQLRIAHSQTINHPVAVVVGLTAVGCFS